MIEAQKREAVYLLHKEGMSSREIGQRLDLSRNTVRVIIEQKGVMPQCRKDKTSIDPELLIKLYQQCDGWIQRIHEKLLEEEKIDVKYSTLTRLLRQLGISGSQKTRCDRVPDEPGVEMQHDTTLYRVKLGERQVQLTASVLYLRYSKRRYLKFYRSFNRFNMKCFLHEALSFWGYSAKNCIIDNTNLARLRGIGKNAIIVPEMEAFARQYQFQFCCHERGHANRKAGEERSFWTVETNFLSGRTFKSLEDINQQGFEWSTTRLDNKPQGKAALIPAKAFEHELNYLTQLLNHIPAPYKSHPRTIDQYGYVAFDGNFYWVPGTERGTVTVLQYSDTVKIYQQRELLIEYPLPEDGTKNKPFSPEGSPSPRFKPKNRKKPTEEEQKHLRAMAPSVNTYIDFILKTKGIAHHEFFRKLFALSRKMTPELFIKSIERATKYRIASIETIKSIANLNLRELGSELPLADFDETFQQREAYQQGSITDLPDLSIYDDTEEEDE